MKPTIHTVTLLLLAATAHAAAAQSTGQKCEKPQPYLGIKTYHCQGGACMVRGWSSTINERLSPEMERLKQNTPGAWGFSVEPRLWQIDPSGPAIRAVHEGDVLVAVDGDPITTRRGGMRLAQIDAGQPVMLTLRRTLRSGGVPYDVVMDVEIVPVPACASLMASAGPGERPGQTEPSTSWSYGSAGQYTVGSSAGQYRADSLAGQYTVGSSSFRYGVTPGTNWAVRGDSAWVTSLSPNWFGFTKTDSLGWNVVPSRRPAYAREWQPATAGVPNVTFGMSLAARDEDVVRLDALGLVLAGAKEITVDEDGVVRWRFATQPYVKEVVAGSRAARAGLQPGEYIVQADEKSVTTLEGAAALTVRADQPVALWVRRGNAARRIVVR